MHSRINNNSLQSDRRICDFANTQSTSAAQLQLLQRAKHAFQQATLLQLFNFFELKLNAKALLAFINTQKDVFNTEAVAWADIVNDLVEKMEATASKFIPVLKVLLDNIELPENNESLQKRLIGAIAHFDAALVNCKHQISKCNAVTDSKVVATDGNKLLIGLHQSICNREHLLASCKNGFFINDFLRQKRTYVKPYFTVTLYAGKSSYQKNDSPPLP